MAFARPAARLGVAAGICLCLSVAGAACGGDEGDGGREARSDAAGVAAAERQLDRFRGIPEFTPPGPAFEASSKVRGTLIYEIPITSEVPFIGAVEQGMEQAADEVGADLVVFPNQGKPSQWAQGIRTAIARKADAILLLAQDPELAGPALAEAREAGIPVISLRTTGEGEPCAARAEGSAPVETCVPAPFEQAGRLEADWVIAASGGSADVLVITSNDARSTAPLVRGLRQEFERNCPGCELRFVDVPIPAWATDIRTEVQSALVRDPGIDYVIPAYDSMSQFIVPALRAGGADDRVDISTFNGTPFVLKMLQDGDVVEMDVGEDLAWVGWASMDQAFRVIAGVPPVPSERTPLRVFDDDNVDEAGRPPRFDRGYGRAYVDGYRELWGVKR
ncbi:MAG TPA: sugar ABC transporter substrate-binding protein [Thermoleophilaceae bacterium]|nr:sugar ABC transporter substrate-binding protein [Thermoleophilaceae bacterium]